MLPAAGGRLPLPARLRMDRQLRPVASGAAQEVCSAYFLRPRLSLLRSRRCGGCSSVDEEFVIELPLFEAF
jgi:hypothetical protein